MASIILNYQDFHNPSRCFDPFLFENSIKSIGKDIEHKVKSLGIDLSDEDACLKFLSSVLKNDGDFKKVKATDLNETVDFSLNEGGDWVEMIGQVGEILGSAAAVQFIMKKIGDHFGGGQNFSKVAQDSYSIVKWIAALTGIAQSMIEKAFEIAARFLGASDIGQKQVGRIGLIIFLSVLLVCSIMVFPAIGSGSFAVVIASIAAMAKTFEIVKVCKEVWDTLKNPTNADTKEFGNFIDMVYDLAKEHGEEKLLHIGK